MEWLGVVCFGIAIVLFGGLFLWRHTVVIRRLQAEAKTTPMPHRNPLLLQQYRRIITSALVIIVGVLIPVSYDQMIRQQNIRLGTLLILMMLAILFAIVVFALMDLVTSSSLKADWTIRKAQTDLQRALLEQELKQFKSDSAQARRDPNSADGEAASS